MSTTVSFDDLDALNAQPSDELGEFGEPVTAIQAKIGGFADLTGVQQWVHLDVERAQRESGARHGAGSPFGYSEHRRRSGESYGHLRAVDLRYSVDLRG